jgi:hypothetical protein
MRAAFTGYAHDQDAASIRRCWSTWNVLCTGNTSPPTRRWSAGRTRQINVQGDPRATAVPTPLYDCRARPRLNPRNPAGPARISRHLRPGSDVRRSGKHLHNLWPSACGPPSRMLSGADLGGGRSRRPARCFWPLGSSVREHRAVDVVGPGPAGGAHVGVESLGDRPPPTAPPGRCRPCAGQCRSPRCVRGAGRASG